MKNVKILSRIIFSFVFFSIISCNKKELTKEKNTKYYFDIVADSIKETIIVEKDIKYSSMKNIFLLNNGVKNKICSITSGLNYLDVNTTPEIENVYLEANNIQTNDKGFRIIVRNTDRSPDIFYIDLINKNQWIIKAFGIINTNIEKPYICNILINRDLNSFKKTFGNNLELNLDYFVTLYFNGKYKCGNSGI